VIELFKGGENDSPCEEPLHQSFRVNDMVHPNSAEPKTRKVFMSCPTMGCSGRHQQPEVHGAAVRCELCTDHYPWLCELIQKSCIVPITYLYLSIAIPVHKNSEYRAGSITYLKHKLTKLIS
jgi:hypothetical protein